MAERLTKTIKKGDTGPPISIRIRNKTSRSPVDLTDATAIFKMIGVNDDSSVVELVSKEATIDVDPTTGQITYNWTSGDTQVTGAHQAYFVITFSGGTVETFPSSSFIEIRIEELSA